MTMFQKKLSIFVYKIKGAKMWKVLCKLHSAIKDLFIFQCYSTLFQKNLRQLTKIHLSRGLEK